MTSFPSQDIDTRDISAAGDKGHTFRKRRLSLTLHKNAAARSSEELEGWSTVAATSNTDEVDSYDSEKAHTFRKRRLSLTQNRLDQSDHTSTSNHFQGKSGSSVKSDTKRRRSSNESLNSIASVGSFAGPAPKRTRLVSKTLHADEILPQYGDQSPPSPAADGILGSVLYDVPAIPRAPVQAPQLGDGSHPKWNKRHTIQLGDEHKLPFPRDIVGTYSCHGVEPVYDEVCDDEVNDDEPPDDLLHVDTPAQIVLPVKVSASKGADNTDPVEQPDQEEYESLDKDVGVSPTMVAKINQDRGGVAFPYGNSRRTALFAVYDGHGQGGELVSQFALSEVQRRLEKHECFVKDLSRAFKETFLEVDEALKKEPLIEPFFSGTTACVALLRDKTLTISNAGDSRAVIGQRDRTTGWRAIDLTEDQNPDLPDEKRRIISSGGYVSPSPGPGLSARVWLDPTFTQIGLAMARSIGDHAVATVGVIAEPVVTTHEVDPEDEFMILASDGVWEFLESDEAVQIVGDNMGKGATKACQALIEAAAARWHEEEGEYRDDITAIVVRLQRLW